ncbi:hypothetical protein BJ742DRAFT_243121 [Cladochytrium replicatum]|nr:hypothetical protein BJ742DRAFT_243121 [Cladochytrium replicatum]
MSIMSLTPAFSRYYNRLDTSRAMQGSSFRKFYYISGLDMTNAENGIPMFDSRQRRKAFDLWHGRTARRITYARKAQAVHEQPILTKSMRIWGKMMGSRGLAVKIALEHRKRKLHEKSLLRWINKAKMVESLSMFAARSVAFKHADTLQSCFINWRLATERRRKIVQLAQTINQVRLTRIIFGVWMKRVLSRQRLMELAAIRKNDRKLVSTALWHWRKLAEVEQTGRAIADLAYTRLLMRLWREKWRFAIADTSRTHGLLDRALRTWKDHYADRCEARKFMEMSEAARNEWLMRRVMEVWRGRFQERRDENVAFEWCNARVVRWSMRRWQQRCVGRWGKIVKPLPVRLVCAHAGPCLTHRLTEGYCI